MHMCMRLLPTEYLGVCGHQPWAFIHFLPKAQQGSSELLGAPQFRGVISPKWPFSGWRMSLRVFFLKVMGSHSLQEPYAYVHVRWVSRHSRARGHAAVSGEAHFFVATAFSFFLLWAGHADGQDLSSGGGRVPAGADRGWQF